MAQEAIDSGMSALEYHKAVLKAQREKGSEYLAQRRAETEKANVVRGASAEETGSAATEEAMDKSAREIAAYAKMLTHSGGRMF